MRKKLANYIESINTKEYQNSLFMFYFLLRKLLTAFTLVFMNKYPNMQIILITHYSIMSLIYVRAYYPYQTTKDNR